MSQQTSRTNSPRLGLEDANERDPLLDSFRKNHVGHDYRFSPRISPSGLLDPTTAPESVTGTAFYEDIPALQTTNIDQKIPNKEKIIVLFVIVLSFLGMMLLTGAAEVDLTYYIVCQYYGVERDICMNDDRVAKEVISLTKTVTLCTSIIELFTHSWLSSASDRFGRKPLILLTMACGFTFKATKYYMVYHSGQVFRPIILLFPTILYALGGGFRLLPTLLTACVTDFIDNPATRSNIIAISEGSFFFCLAVFPTLGSSIIKMTSLKTLFEISLVLCLVCIFACSVFVTESLQENLKKLNSVRRIGLRQSIELLKFKNVTDRLARRNVLYFLACSIVGSDLIIAFSSVIMLYPRAKFHWTAVELGYCITLMAGTRTIMFAFGFPRLYRHLCKKWTMNPDLIDHIDKFMLRLCLGLISIGYLLMGYSQTSKQYALSGVLDSCSSIGMPIMKTALIKHTDTTQIGTFLAGYSLISSLISIVLPPIFLQLYQWSYDFRRFLCFETIAGLFLSLFILTFFIRIRGG